MHSSADLRQAGLPIRRLRPTVAPRSAVHLPPLVRLEGRRNVLNSRPESGSGPRHRDHIEARRVFQQFMSLQIGQSGADQSPLLLDGDRFQRMAGLVRTAGFHFDKDDRPPLDSHKVNLTLAGPPIPLDNLVAAPPEVPGGRALTSLAQ